MLAFTDTVVTKDEFVASLKAHRAADRIAQGRYWAKGRGCAVGCGVESIMQATGRTMNHSDHAAYAEATGIPESLVRLQDTIFERLPIYDARDWPVRFAEAVKPGADLSDVTRRFLVRLLREIVLPVAAASAPIVTRVADGLDSRWRIGDTAADAALAAADANATTAAWVAAWAAADAAAWAADAAAWAAGGRIADILIDEIERAGTEIAA